MRFAPRSYDGSLPKQFVERPVIGLDIDGTIADYHGHFKWFAEQYTGKPLGRSDLYDGLEPFYKWLGLSKSTYRQIKLAFRRGGLKRSMPVYEHASDMTCEWRQQGALVIICTTRPYLQLENIESDTRHWLKRHGIQHDGLISGEHKYRDLKKLFGPQVIAVVEDLPEQIHIADKLSLPRIIRSQPHNAELGGPRQRDLMGVYLEVEHRIHQYKIDHEVTQ